MSKKRITEPTVRISKDAVTGKLESVVLDSCQRAYERIHQTIDGYMLGLSDADKMKLATKLVTLTRAMLPHTDKQLEEATNPEPQQEQ